MYWVGCTITTLNTNLSCDIQIGEKRKDGKTLRMDWEEMGGRLDLGEDRGRWFNFAPNREHKGIVLFPHKDDEESAGAYSDADILVTLLDVPERFSEKLGCGEYFGGAGLLHKTRETVHWRMWYPCA
jgi:hypothetical protein